MSFRKTAIVVLGLMWLSVGASLSGREMTSNCELYGAVTIRNAQAQVGATIKAYVGGTLLADSTVQVKGRYAIAIPPDNPVTIEQDGWMENDEITIVVNGEPARPTITAFEGTLQVDLTVQLVSDVRKSTWGKIKALFR